MPSDPSNPAHPESPAPKPARGMRLGDLVTGIVFLVIIAVLIFTLMKQLSLRHEVNTARATTDKLISAMQQQNAYAAMQLGDASFRSQHDTSQLSYLFDQSKDYTKGSPTVVKQTVNNGKANRVVSIYYKFTAAKPFYVRVTAIEPNTASSWKIINFSGNGSLNALTR